MFSYIRIPPIFTQHREQADGRLTLFGVSRSVLVCVVRSLGGNLDVDKPRTVARLFYFCKPTMKTNFTFKAGSLRRVLLLVVMMSLWQVGWAADSFKKMVRDGVTYYYGASDSFADKYGKNIALVGVEPTKFGDNHITENMLPKQATIKILSDVTADGITYPVVGFYDGEEILGEPDYDDYAYVIVGIYEDVVKDIYFTRFFPDYLNVKNYTLPPTVEGRVTPQTVVHVSESMMDELIKRDVICCRVTDGKRWYSSWIDYSDPDSEGLVSSPLKMKQGDAIYELNYPADQNFSAAYTVGKYQPEITVPLTVNDGNIDLPVNSVSINFSMNSASKKVNLYLQKLIKINTKYHKYAVKQLTVNVPTNLYDAAVARYGQRFTVTDGLHSNENVVETYTDDAGFEYKITIRDGTRSVELTKIPDIEEVRVPEKMHYAGQDVAINALSFNSCGNNVKDIYFGSLLPESFSGKNATVHVSDAQFDAALAFGVKCVRADSRRALNSSLFTFENSSWLEETPTMFYDVDGNGKLDFFKGSFVVRWGSGYKAECFGMTKAVSLDGEELFFYSNTVAKAPYEEEFYGHFAQLSRDGKPYWVDLSGLVYDMSGNLVLDNYRKGNGFAATADINGDGCKEILPTLNDGDGAYNIKRVLADGTFVNDKIYVTSDTTVLGSIDDYTPNSGVITKRTGGSGIPSIGHDMFVKSKENPFFDEITDDNTNNTGSEPRMRLVKEGNQLKAMSLPTGELSASDYNGDGLIDLNDGKNIYYNLGGNRFFRSPHKGTVFSTDLTGNGLLDHIDFTNTQTDLYISKPDGSMGEPKTLLKNQAVKKVFFGDFDHDGDVDILFFINSSDYTLFQFYRNDGNGVFRAKDDNVDGLYTAIACNDYDGDGLYEILAYTKYKDPNTGYQKTESCLFKISSKWGVSKVDLPKYFEMAADLDNDGFMEMLSNMGNYTLIDKIPGAVKNMRPEKMSKPSAVAFADAYKLKLSWARGKDKETSSCDLTYELRIGTASGKGDIYHGNANADGTRRVLSDGNMGRALSYMYDTSNLVEGKYYIAIQAVDASGLGGEWSDELVYDHKLSAPVITSMASNVYCTADTVTLSVQNPVAAAAYEWTIDNGDIIGQNDNASMVKVRFREAGTRKFSVSMMLGGKTTKSDEEKIEVIPSRVATIVAADNQTLIGKNLIDINQDGNAEIVYSSTFYERKSDGSYAAIRKTWNTDLRDIRLFADFNNDGYPDILTSGKVLYNSGEGDKSFDGEEVTINGFGGRASYMMDWNNDGKFALGSENRNLFYVDQKGDFNYSILRSSDSYMSAEELGKFYDFNRDGNMDVWYNERDYAALNDQTKVRLKVPGGNMDFDTDGKLYYQNSHEYSMRGFADFNNDGYADGYFFDNGYMVIVKGKPMSEWPCTETVAIPVGPAYSYDMLLDVDNNGYLDILSTGNVWLMDKDFKYTKMQSPFGLDKDGHDLGSDYYDEFHWQPLTPGAYPNGLASSIANEAPSVPANVSAQNTANGLLLKWDDATDDRTPWAQMRYNVSLKVKGKTGAGAFVLSPMNGLSDEAAILSGVYYRKATQLTVPASALTEGTTYEVQVQAIDLMGEHSAMSAPVEIVFRKEGFISANMTTLYRGIMATLSYSGQHKQKITCDPGEDGTVVNEDADKGTFDVRWMTPGMKTVTMNVDGNIVKADFNVAKMPSLHVFFPEKVMLNSEVTVKVPEAFVSKGFENGRFSTANGDRGDNFSVTYTPGDSTATFVFTEAGQVRVNTSVKVPEAGTLWDTSSATVVDQVMPEAKIVSVEGDGRYYRVNWSTNVPDMVDKVEIARETNRLGQFEVLDVVPVANATWCDLTSDNRIQPQRYRIRLLANNGVQTSGWSEAHNPLHVDINQTADGRSINLMWNTYEGLDVESYVIMRGTSANKLQTIATVPASQLSYTDADAPEGVCYYAVRFNEVRAMARGVMCVQQLDDKVQSNVISSVEAMPTIAASDITIIAAEKNAVLNNSQSELHLSAVILPVYATYNKVGWTIVSGGDYASVASNGLLTATGGKGDVVVRATTLDGSNLSAEITVSCDYSVLAKSIGIFKPKSTVKVGESIQLEAVIMPRNVSMKDVKWTSLDEQVATVDVSGVVKGISQGKASIVAKTNDGTGLVANVTIDVVEPTGIGHVVLDGDADIQYFTVDGKKIDKPVRGQVYITNKGDKVLYK